MQVIVDNFIKQFLSQRTESRVLMLIELACTSDQEKQCGVPLFYSVQRSSTSPRLTHFMILKPLTEVECFVFDALD